MSNSVHDMLQELHDVIITERESAKALDLDTLQAATLRKGELLQQLDVVGGLNAENRELAEKIRFENRRNAYLLWSALNWIRESMEFFGRRSTPDAYTPGGDLVVGKNGGHLLSGRA